MPQRDSRGPEGKGPRTGRQMGNCEGAKPLGRGFGPCGREMRRGFGRGFGYGAMRASPAEAITLTLGEKKKILEAELRELEAEKQEIEKRLKELK